MNPTQIKRIAEAYAGAPHRPGSLSYVALVRETRTQFDYLIDRRGWLFFPTDKQPYATSEKMFAHCKNKYLYFFTGGDVAITGHPLFDGPNRLGYTPNDQFRCVHDVNGHYAGLHPFETFAGEVAAYNRHKLMYSREALSALFGETIGQLCYYFHYGKFVDVQKCAIIPMEEIEL